TSYEIEIADGKIVSTNTILRGCSLNLVNHLFEIDLMPIELGTFDVIIRMVWLSEHDAIIVCGEKIIRIPYKNKTLIIEGDRDQVTKKEPVEKRVEDVPVIRDFPEVFPEDLPGLPLPRKETDIKEKDTKRSQKDKTKHGTGKSVKPTSKKVKVNKSQPR
ncbi:putative reverse transcriptase domain-containing protein, partial [Tanacetum coccineum]